MRRGNLREIGYIAPINSLRSIFRHGLLSFNERRARGIAAVSVADAAVQAKRDKKVVPNGLALHDYANMYICPRNPMLYRVRNGAEPVCVVRVDGGVLDVAGAVIADKNASSDYVRFYPSPDGLKHIDESVTFARYWNHEDPIEKMRHVSAMCAEVLVPRRVDPRFLVGVKVKNSEHLLLAKQHLRNVRVDIDKALFFLE